MQSQLLFDSDRIQRENRYPSLSSVFGVGRMSLEFLESNRGLKFDYLPGLRARGLVLYGILPASLAALGLLQVQAVGSKFEGDNWPFIFLAVVPLVVLYLIVRQRLRAWYLLERHLWARTAMIALLILAFSSTISWAGGALAPDVAPTTGVSVLLAKGTVSSPWWTQLFEAVLLGLVVLVASSTLFMTVIKESGDLPGLPSADFVTHLGALRNSLAVLWRDDIWREEVGASATFQNDLRIARENAGKLSLTSPKGSAQQGFFEDLARDLTLAAGGSVITSSQLITALQRTPFPSPDACCVGLDDFDTTDFPAGQYRYYVEYKRLGGGGVIHTATVDFEIE